MKRTAQFFRPLLSLALVLVVLLPLFCSCKQEPEIDLTYDKKYILARDAGNSVERQTYFLFRNNGMGVYQYYSYSDALIVINFRYIIENDHIVCFYDSLESDSGSFERLFGTTWTASLRFSKRVLIENRRDFNCQYICEDFLSEIPNFGKPLSTEE